MNLKGFGITGMNFTITLWLRQLGLEMRFVNLIPSVSTKRHPKLAYLLFDQCYSTYDNVHYLISRLRYV